MIKEIINDHNENNKDKNYDISNNNNNNYYYCYYSKNSEINNRQTNIEGK